MKSQQRNVSKQYPEKFLSARGPELFRQNISDSGKNDWKTHKNIIT